jgi:hypothetical protein
VPRDSEERFTQGSGNHRPYRIFPDLHRQITLREVMLTQAIVKFTFATEKTTDKALLLRARVRLAELWLEKRSKANATAHLKAADELDEDKLFEEDRARLRRLIEEVP